MSRSSESRWLGEAAYRVLSYSFSIRWEWESAAERLDRALGSFAVPPDPKEERSPTLLELPPRYSFLGPGSRRDGRYRLLCDRAELTRSKDPEKVFSYLLWHVNAEALRRTDDFLLIHAGAAAGSGGAGVLLPGASGSGKTTLVAGLVRDGFSYLSDEAGVIDPATGRLFPYPRAITLKTGSFTHFPELAAAGEDFSPSRAEWHVRPEDLGSTAPGKPCEIRFVVAIRYVPETATSLTSISKAAGVMEVATNSMNLTLFGGHGLRALEGALRHARCFRLVSGDLPSAVHAVSDLVNGSRRRTGKTRQAKGRSKRATSGASSAAP